MVSGITLGADLSEELPADVADVSALLRFALQNVGVVAAVCQACLSGFAGVYTEWKLKGRSAQYTLWEQIWQLPLYSVTFGLLSFAGQPVELQQLRDEGFFHGFSALTWFIIVLNSCGGLLVAGLLLYADNITKNFASTVSLISTSLFSYALYRDTTFSVSFVCGAIVVLAAIAFYNEDILQLAEHNQAVRASRAGPVAQQYQPVAASGGEEAVELEVSDEEEKEETSREDGMHDEDATSNSKRPPHSIEQAA